MEVTLAGFEENPAISPTRSRLRHSKAIRDIIAGRLQKRITEIRGETDQNATGARTILRWIECDLACFDSCVAVHCQMDTSLPEDGFLERVDDSLRSLYRSAKIILISGRMPEILNENRDEIDCSDYALSRIPVSQFSSRFHDVADMITKAVREIKDIEWSEKSNGC